MHRYRYLLACNHWALSERIPRINADEHLGEQSQCSVCAQRRTVVKVELL